MTRAGFVTIVGKPNAGKSTLLNRLVGERLAIVSPKPQSTRDRVVGILTDESSQIVLFDTPGLLEPRYALHRAMQHAAQKAIADADLIVHLVDASEDVPTDLTTLAGLPHAPKAPVLLALNKVDRVSAARRAEFAERYPDAVQLAGGRGQGVDDLLSAIRARLPESPFLYPEDDEQLEDEVPYGVAVEIEEFRETTDPVYIRAVLHVERDSQKRILIGAGGSRIKSLGQETRRKIEPLIGKPVFLDLWVKVLGNWRRNAASLERLGYKLPPVEPL
jgi:GTP-binding protein Era